MRTSLALGLVVALALVPACNDLPTGPADVRPLAIRAFNIADWTPFGYSSAQGLTSIDEIADTGANGIVFIYTIYQEDRYASSVGPMASRTADLGSLRIAVDHAAGLGLEVILKIHVDVLDGSWRGFIAPEEPDLWFASLRAAVEPLLVMGRSAGVTQLVLGTELVRTLPYETQWRELVAFVRGIYDGQICYAASWDEIERVPFWDLMDVVGVNFYFPVTSRTGASCLDMLAGWQPWLDRLDTFRRRIGRNITLTEIGYMSREGAGMDPANYRLGSAIDLQEQADLYWAALQAVAGEDWIDGICWWDWAIQDLGGAADGGYTPRGKPALDVLRAAWRSLDAAR